MHDEIYFPCRKSPRIKNYDYASPNYYFVTICTFQKKCIFGSAETLNRRGKTALHGMELIGTHFPGVCVDKAVVMPNHIHAIVIQENDRYKLTTVIGSYKAYVTRMLRKYEPNIQVWQSSFHDHIIRNRESYQKIWEYIDNNPRKWKDDVFYTLIL